MDWIKFLLVFSAICVIWFFITRIWVSGVELIFSAIKKIFGLDKNKSVGTWHTLEDIKDKKENDTGM